MDSMDPVRIIDICNHMRCYFKHTCMSSSYYEYLIHFADAISSYLLRSSKLMTSETTKLASAKRETRSIETWDVKEK